MAPQPASSPAPRGSSAGWIIAVAIIVLAAAGLIIFRHQVVPGVKAVFAKIFHKAPQPEIIVADTISVTIPEPVTVPQEVIPPSKKYYIIVASFRDERNADKYVEFLQQKGFEPAKIPRIRKNMYAVSCTSFSTQEEALQNLNHYRNKVNSKAWVLGYQPQ